MSEILSIGGNGNPLQPIGHRRTSDAVVNPAASRPGDSVEVSHNAQLLAKLAGLPDVRTDLVDNIRGQISGGTYDPDGAKFDQAFDAMLDDL